MKKNAGDKKSDWKVTEDLKGKSNTYTGRKQNLPHSYYIAFFQEV